jgi:hypothetical protein
MLLLRPGGVRGACHADRSGARATLQNLSGAALRGGGRQARLFECSGYACYECRSHLREGYLILRSEAEVLGACVPVGLEGGFTLRDGGLRFEPGRLEALGVPVPRRFTQDLLRGASFAYPLELPFGRSPALKCVKAVSCSLARWRIRPAGEVWVPVARPSSLWYLLLGLQVPEGELGGRCVSGNPS